MMVVLHSEKKNWKKADTCFETGYYDSSAGGNRTIRERDRYQGNVPSNNDDDMARRFPSVAPVFKPSNHFARMHSGLAAKIQPAMRDTGHRAHDDGTLD